MDIPKSGDELLKLVNKNTTTVMTPRWTRNIIANEEMIKKGKGVREFFVGERASLTKDIPAIVVSAGPSVDKNLHLLPKAVGKAVILVVDSMVKNVMNLGIKPDIVITTDAEWGEWGNCLDDLPMSVKGVPLLADVFVNKKVIEVWEAQGGKVFWYAVVAVEGHPLSQIVEPEFTGGPIGRLACGGCVSSVAFAFAQGALRCDPVIMIGQDCGYYEKRHHHATGIDFAEEQSVEQVDEDIYGRPILTTPVLKTYAFWLETIVSGRYTPGSPNINGTFINATEGGIVKKGWLLQPFSYVIKKYLTKKYNIQKLLFPPKKKFVKPKITGTSLDEQFLRSVMENERLTKPIQTLYDKLVKRELALPAEDRKRIVRVMKTKEGKYAIFTPNEAAGDSTIHLETSNKEQVIQWLITKKCLINEFSSEDTSGRIPEQVVVVPKSKSPKPKAGK